MEKKEKMEEGNGEERKRERVKWKKKRKWKRGMERRRSGKG